jgi:predicted lysophospholipase L1 biosynthesis ABC-type transport system permease subunit
VSGVSITIQVEATGETLTFSVDNRTRVLAGPGRTSPLDLRPGDAVLIKSTEGELRARIVASPDAMRRNMPNLGPRVIPSPFASHPKP